MLLSNLKSSWLFGAGRHAQGDAGSSGCLERQLCLELQLRSVRLWDDGNPWRDVVFARSNHRPRTPPPFQLKLVSIFNAARFWRWCRSYLRPGKEVTVKHAGNGCASEEKGASVGFKSSLQWNLKSFSPFSTLLKYHMQVNFIRQTCSLFYGVKFLYIYNLYICVLSI